MRSQVRAFHLLLSPTQVVHNHIHPPTTPTSFFSLCPFSCKVIFKLPGSKPGVITDSVPQGAHVHTHTPTLPNQAVLRCLSAHSPLLLSASSFSIVTTLTQALHTHLPNCPQPQIRGSGGSLHPPGNFQRTSLGPVPSGIWKPGTIIRGSELWNYQENLEEKNLSCK